MSRRCPLTGKQTRSGHAIARRGKAKYLGGVGRKITGKTKRKFRVNMQRVRAVINGSVVRINVAAKAIHTGMIQRPPKRNYTPPEDEEAKEPRDQEAKEPQDLEAKKPQDQEAKEPQDQEVKEPQDQEAKETESSK